MLSAELAHIVLKGRDLSFALSAVHAKSARHAGTAVFCSCSLAKHVHAALC